MGLIAASALTDTSFARLLQVCAVLFFIAAAVSAIMITNPAVPPSPFPVKLPRCAAPVDAHPHLRHAHATAAPSR